MATNTDIFLGSGASLTFVPETDLYIEINHSSSSATKLNLIAAFIDNYRLLTDLYVGCIVDLYDANGTGAGTTPASTHIITSNDHDSISISPAHTIPSLESGDFIIIRGYGAPCVGPKGASNEVRLNADNWLGLVESATFPNVEQEMKQMNIQLGGSRNFTHQYKGIRTASGGNINVVANHGTWLYYALGQCTSVTHTSEGTAPTDGIHGEAVDKVYIENASASLTGAQTTNAFSSTGPIFYKSASSSDKSLMPPIVANLDTVANIDEITRTTSTATAIAAPITYTFAESDTADLPSFALEQTLSKFGNNSTMTTETGSASESHNFVRIARGNRVNTFTLTANENEEVKFTMDLNTRAVNKLSQGQNYEARGGQATNSSLFNFPPSTDAELLEPFFFSSGSFSIFGQQFLKITNLTLTINNNLQDKRFVGIGNKDIKSGIPSQRTYELTFTAMVTDDKLFEELFTETEVASGTSTIDLQFDKQDASGGDDEQIIIKLKDYFLSSSNVTIPDDKGPITIEATVMPRQLDTCTVKTHWVLQG
tara:strand:- start:91 stop:1710 length:1620 start_codon:yes stop_codon:yes gene_type:complete